MLADFARPVRRLFTIAFILCLYLPAWADTVEPFVMPSARFRALGGNHSAMADDFYAIFLNPAALADVKEEFSAAEMSLGFYGPMLEIIDLARKSDDEDLDISALVGPGGFAAGFEMGGPLSLGWVGRGLGFGIFNRVKANASVGGTRLNSLASGELLFTGGYGFRIINKGSHTLDGGFMGKGFFRGLVDLRAEIFNIDELFNDPGDQPFDTHLGLGLDLGLRYIFAENLSLALVCYDVYSPVLVTRYDSMSDFGDGSKSGTSTSYATVYRRLDMGIKYRIRSTLIDRYITQLTVMADYRDVLDLFSLVSRNPVLNIGLGLELTVLNALSFRVGIGDALPALGFGLDLSFMTLDFAVYGKELGLDPGTLPVYAMDIGFLFRY